MCEYVGKLSRDLKIHKIRAHLRKSYKTLCVVCGERFQTVQCLQQHVREKHTLDCVNDSPLTFDQFGWEETLIDLVRAKAHVIGTYIVQQS